MYDIAQLESQWRQYKRKRVLLPIGIFAMLIGVSIFGYFIWIKVSVPQTGAKNSSPDVPKIGEKKPVKSIKPGQVLIPPESVSGSVPLSTEVPSVKSIPRRDKEWRMTFADAESTPKTSSVVSPLKRVDIHVTSKKSSATVQEIESRFRFAKDKDDSLFLARYYYDKKQYKKALNWSLETNKLDSDMEESWLIFGRAKAKLGQRMEAIRVLQAYYDRTGSKKAKRLLDKVRRGKTL